VIFAAIPADPKTLAYSDERHSPGDPQERPMSHQPPKESKKKPQQTPKEKKLAKQQKKHLSDTAPFLKK
jgi:hypothetical protein